MAKKEKKEVQKLLKKAVKNSKVKVKSISHS